MSKLGQKPAFPITSNEPGYMGRNDIKHNVTYKGVSKRYWTAVMIAQGATQDTIFVANQKELVKRCYEIADELLEQENK
ncbi:MAG: hypothetical protein H8E51_07085 [Bacteroidetes bacterium]|nr:hypothetical protein [Bacteroidota bacterium]